MYAPKHFKQEDSDALFTLIEQNPFGVLAITDGGKLEVSHAPMLVDRDVGPHGRLRFHLARANSWWRAIDGAAEALAVFQGAAAYVSPDWYVSENLVPTWNYTAVHASGVPEIMSDDELVQLLDDLSAPQEANLLPKRPWTSDKLPEQMFQAMRKAIVGVSIPITSLEGKWKLGQNKKTEDRIASAKAMMASSQASTQMVGRQMAEISD